MTKGPNLRKEARRALIRVAHTPALFRLGLCLLVLMGLTACVRRQAQVPPQLFDFTKDLRLGKEVLAVQRMDTDSDKVDEWVVFYRFDKVGEGGPIAALIYDLVRDKNSQLPMLFPYKLRTPDQSYLAEKVPNLSLHHILPESGDVPRAELVFGTNSELAIFRLDYDPEAFDFDKTPLYRCIGFFRSDEVSFDAKTFVVTVTSRAGYERSQLVTRSYYRPEVSALLDGYFVAATTTLPTPYESKVDFPEGAIPAAVMDTPYPEKIVLAFYQTLGQTNPPLDILYYLSSQAATEFKEGKLKYGSPFATDEVKRAVVVELSYYPTQDTDNVAHVRVSVIYHSKSGQQSNPIETNWRLVRSENRWKMDYPGQ